MISIVPYRSTWQKEFETIGSGARSALGDLALRIDHIGSTAVPGLAAKDVIDVQITVEKIQSPIELALNRAGYTRLAHIERDHVPSGSADDVEQWRKWFFNAASNERPVHLHVRIAGRANQRYPLLFRDYLRANSIAAQTYAQIKTELARHHADDVEAYYDIKDPVCDLIMNSAEAWAMKVDWKQGPSDCL